MVRVLRLHPWPRPISFLCQFSKPHLSIAELGGNGKGHLAAPALPARPIPRLSGFSNPKLPRFRAAPSARPRLMHALERLFKLCLEILIGTIGRTGARNHHVIAAWPHLRGTERAYGDP